LGKKQTVLANYSHTLFTNNADQLSALAAGKAIQIFFGKHIQAFFLAEVFVFKTNPEGPPPVPSEQCIRWAKTQLNLRQSLSLRHITCAPTTRRAESTTPGGSHLTLYAGHGLSLLGSSEFLTEEIRPLLRALFIGFPPFHQGFFPLNNNPLRVSNRTIH
jgi:hypothetical protein